MSNDPAAIARRLTPAQKRALLWFRSTQRTAYPKCGAPSQNTLMALVRFDLCLPDGQYWDGTRWSLTGLGEAVRAVLEQEASRGE